MNHATLTHPGLRRSHNEDAVLADPANGLFAVFDGVGGHAAGDRAARLARSVFEEAAPEFARLARACSIPPRPADSERVRRALEAACQRASRAVFEMGERENLRRTATTVVAALVGRGVAWVVHVGDSRAYLLRGGRLHRITEDHTLLNELLARGAITAEEAAASTRRNVITRALGAAPEVVADAVRVEILEGDRLLLCSDGLTDCAGAGEIRAALAAGEPAEAADALVRAALAGGGRDNVTVAVVDLEPAGAADLVAARARVLAGLPIFVDLDPSQRLRLGRFVEDVQVPAGAVIVEQGATGSAMYAVVSGRVVVERDGAVLAHLGPGEPFGELALVDNQPRSARVRAEEPTHLLRIEREVFARFCREHPHLAIYVLWRLAALVTERLRVTTEQLAASRAAAEILPLTSLP